MAKKKKNKGNAENNNHNHKNNNNNNNNYNNNNNNNDDNNSNDDNNNNNNNGGKKEENNNNNTTVLKVAMHCDGCASKIIKHLHSIKGVETVKAESETGKVTVTGNVDPTKLRDNLAEKTKKNVELISPQPKKGKEKENKENESNKISDDKKTDDKKNKDKETVSTAVLKMSLHCQGCCDKIGKMVSKTKGVLEIAIDKEKETVTVKGTMDVKALVENLTEKFKRKVEIVPSKKDKEGGEGGEGGGGKKKNKNKGGGGGGGGGEGGANNDNNEGGEVKIIEYSVQPPFGHGNEYVRVEGYNYPQVYEELLHMHMHSQPPQMFSDENPNACLIM
ncbi:heavy metal-associated isoprenylated plant protein 3-like [Cicer arietinum]|uniref:Heavy metal-associated isoprenylated plant protein 3-like n=1 Tax=Cicer arietinum TaxID=3827 RepID=A0A1S2YKM7_CICAR|nr:heavy metal-associated isoprenylated plant protein 3-like [Cicer arietinum]